LGSKNISDKIKEDEKKAQEAEEEAEQGNARSQKLLNSKDNNRGKVIFQFSFFVALIAAYFIADYVTGTQQQNNIRKGMNHLEMLSSINPDFRYMTTFTLEEIVVGSQNDLYTFAGNNKFFNELFPIFRRAQS